jgi:hypothetical protein
MNEAIMENSRWNNDPLRGLRRSLLFFAVSALSAAIAPAARAASLDSVLAEQKATDTAAVEAQTKIDALKDETQDMAVKYREALAVAESMQKYGDQLSAQLDSQNRQLAEIKRQLAEIEVTQRDILPLMERMIATLERFVELDVPFLVEERRNRVATLKQLLGRADVSTSEKYRRILEAYQIEMEYGRTLDAYTGKLGEGADARTVQFVRLGRVTLMYQTLDGDETGYWNAAEKAWVVDAEYARDVKRALSVAKKEGAPDLVMLPVPAPGGVKP